MCSEPTTLATLMVKVDKYATTDSMMRIKVSTNDKPIQSHATTLPAGDNHDQHNNERKSDQPDPRNGSKQVTTVEEEQPATQAGNQR
ncbi:hypothetical protein D1007_31092 [Hordeum vulgare]|nr:hypothetical protein D1007_31092 [Hordeum vulgare]